MKKSSFDVIRENMVNEQLIPRGISDEKVLQAFKRVPRHTFVSNAEIKDAYGDFPLPIGESQTISQPYMVALMTELLDLKKDDKVLEIGAGSGYQAAILAELAKEIYSVERIPDLAESAERILKGLGYESVNIRVGDGTLGWMENAPYNAIIVTAGAPKVPQALLDQLAEGGRLVLPLGGRYSQMLTIVKKSKGKFETQDVCACVFVPLVGKEGWKKGG